MNREVRMDMEEHLLGLLAVDAVDRLVGGLAGSGGEQSWTGLARRRSWVGSSEQNDDEDQQSGSDESDRPEPPPGGSPSGRRRPILNSRPSPLRTGPGPFFLRATVRFRLFGP